MFMSLIEALLTGSVIGSCGIMNKGVGLSPPNRYYSEKQGIISLGIRVQPANFSKKISDNRKI